MSAKAASPELNANLGAIEAAIGQLLHADPILQGLDSHKIEQGILKCLVAAQNLHLETVEEIQNRQKEVLQKALGIRSLTAFAKAKQLRKLRRYRNCLLGGLLLLHYAGIGAKENPLESAPPLPTATRTDRPMESDEELLFRLAVYATWWKGGRAEVVAIRAALLACGACSSETTEVAPCDADDPRNPTVLTLKGAANFAGKRTVSIPGWVQPLLAQAFSAHMAKYPGAQNSPVAYGGKHAAGSHRACAAASSTIRQLLDAAGLSAVGLKPQSIRSTRIATVLTSEGLRPALDVAGSTSVDQVLRLTGTSVDGLLRIDPGSRSD